MSGTVVILGIERKKKGFLEIVVSLNFGQWCRLEGFFHHRDRSCEDSPTVSAADHATAAQGLASECLVRRVKCDHGVIRSLFSLDLDGSCVHEDKYVERHAAKRLAQFGWIFELCVCQLATRLQPFQSLIFAHAFDYAPS